MKNFLLFVLSIFFTNNLIAEPKTFKIGITAPLSGDLAPIGQEILRGFELASKDKSNENIQFKVIYEDDQFYFFVRNSSGYFPVEFQFLGFESTFYVFGDDGFLRYTNDSEMDLAMRVTEFRKIFETIRSIITDTGEIKTGVDHASHFRATKSCTEMCVIAIRGT